MISKSKNGKNKTAKNERFHSKIIALGCPVTREECEQQLQLHHCVGAKVVINGRHIGETFVIPLHHIVHLATFHKDAEEKGYKNRHYNQSEFKAAHGTDLELFMIVMQQYAERYGNDDEDIDMESVKLILDQ